MARAYQQPGLSIGTGHSTDPALVRALQADLRALGYLRAGIDGAFGPGTAGAVSALQYDLLNNAGTSSQKDGNAPVAIRDYNRGRVASVTGVMDQGLAACLDELMGDPNVTKLPSSPDPAGANRAALAAVAGSASTVAPPAFVLAIAKQESAWQHFHVPAGADQDGYVTVGLDHNNPAAPYAVTSRGYGLGQYTLFHHPPTAEEVAKFIADPEGNTSLMFTLLQSKLENNVVGPGDRADDRTADHPDNPPLRVCKYAANDPRYLADCRTCAAQAGTVSIQPGQPVYPGASLTWAPSQYYASASYTGVPNRAAFPCDWPYAVRRYNGSGINSYHYQARVLLNLLTVPAPVPVG